MPARSEPEHLHLQQDRDQEIVIGLKGANVPGGKACLREGTLACSGMAIFGDIGEVLRDIMMSALPIAQGDDEFVEPLFLGAFPGRHQQPIQYSYEL